MTKNPPSESRQPGIASSSTLLRAAILATAVASFASPSASAAGIVADVGILSIPGTGILDLTNSNLVVRTTPFATVYGYVQSGLLGGVNGWDGPGINSSLAAAALSTTSAYAVGVIDNSAFGGLYGVIFPNWPPAPGVTLNGTETLVKYTYWGDLDLDGIMTGQDQSLFNDGFTSGMAPGSLPGGAWFNGDMDFDGIYTGQDQSFFNNGFAEYNSNGGIALDPGEAPAGAAAVPEPSAALLLSASVFGLLIQRRRNRAES